jgi:hypothetical protein
MRIRVLPHFYLKLEMFFPRIYMLRSPFSLSLCILFDINVSAVIEIEPRTVAVYLRC